VSTGGTHARRTFARPPPPRHSHRPRRPEGQPSGPARRGLQRPALTTPLPPLLRKPLASLSDHIDRVISEPLLLRPHPRRALDLDHDGKEAQDRWPGILAALTRSLPQRWRSIQTMGSRLSIKGSDHLQVADISQSPSQASVRLGQDPDRARGLLAAPHQVGRSVMLTSSARGQRATGPTRTKPASGAAQGGDRGLGAPSQRPARLSSKPSGEGSRQRPITIGSLISAIVQ